MRLSEFISFYIRARTKHHVDSPFIFDFISSVLENTGGFREREEIESLRKDLLGDETPIRYEVLGAPSQMKFRHFTIGSMARTSLAPPREALVLHHLVRQYQPTSGLELGTSFGITTLYQHFANPEMTLISIEGNQSVYEKAHWIINNMCKADKAPQLVSGLFDDCLEPALNRLGKLDYAFIDGDHRYEKLLLNYQRIKPHLHSGSIVAIHDIHWSNGMIRAWKEISSDPAVKVALDLWHTGILFYRSENVQKIKMSLVLSFWKPWSLGLFRTFNDQSF